nr:DapH/DapD/GlmU-related protein [Legionella pneumophila]
MGERVLIGAGAVVLPGVTIDDGAIIGAGSVVVKDVKENAVVKGVPAV